MSTALNPSRLDFSYNWNSKLDCKAFTTLRLSNRFMIGDVVEVWEKGTYKGDYKVMDKKTIHGLQNISNWIAWLDTGYDAEETCKILRRMYVKVTEQEWATKAIYYYLLVKTM